MQSPKLHQSSKSSYCRQGTNVRPRRRPIRAGVIFADEQTGSDQTTARTKGASSSLRTLGVQTRRGTKVKSASGVPLFEPASEADGSRVVPAVFIMFRSAGTSFMNACIQTSDPASATGGHAQTCRRKSRLELDRYAAQLHRRCLEGKLHVARDDSCPVCQRMQGVRRTAHVPRHGNVVSTRVRLFDRVQQREIPACGGDKPESLSPGVQHLGRDAAYLGSSLAEDRNVGTELAKSSSSAVADAPSQLVPATLESTLTKARSPRSLTASGRARTSPSCTQQPSGLPVTKPTLLAWSRRSNSTRTRSSTPPGISSTLRRPGRGRTLRRWTKRDRSDGIRRSTPLRRDSSRCFSSSRRRGSSRASELFAADEFRLPVDNEISSYICIYSRWLVAHTESSQSGNANFSRRGSSRRAMRIW